MCTNRASVTRLLQTWGDQADGRNHPSALQHLQKAVYARWARQNRRMESADRELVRMLREVLAALADPARATGMQAYMRSAMPYRGISAPTLRAALRPVLAAHPLPDEEVWQATVRDLWDGAAFREERYAALALARHRLHREHQQVHTLDLYEHLVRTGAWWDLVDETATHLVRDLLLAHPAEVSPVVRTWAVSEDLWVRRAAIICQVGAGERCDQDLLASVVEDNLDGSTRTTPAVSPYGREFFIRKGIGWALRDHARTDPAWVVQFVASHEDRLSGLSRREALKHLDGALPPAAGRTQSGSPPSID
jgi:3-methyladenine DNA glycosylase AlkD